VENALEACSLAEHGTVEVSARRETLHSAWFANAHHAPGLPGGDYAVIEVRDDGPGMDDDTLARAFEPFFSTRFQGRGLGLPGTLGIVRSHGGALRATSTPGRGTSVQIALPLSTSEAESLPQAS
jgi:signal transduction histidine kinase